MRALRPLLVGTLMIGAIAYLAWVWSALGQLVLQSLRILGAS